MATTLKTHTEDARKDLIQKERERHLNGEGKSLSWKGVKNIAFNKAQRDGHSHSLSKKAKHTQMGQLAVVIIRQKKG